MIIQKCAIIQAQSASAISAQRRLRGKQHLSIKRLNEYGIIRMTVFEEQKESCHFNNETCRKMKESERHVGTSKCLPTCLDSWRSPLSSPVPPPPARSPARAAVLPTQQTLSNFAPWKRLAKEPSVVSTPACPYCLLNFAKSTGPPLCDPTADTSRRILSLAGVEMMSNGFPTLSQTTVDAIEADFCQIVDGIRSSSPSLTSDEWAQAQF